MIRAVAVRGINAIGRFGAFHSSSATIVPARITAISMIGVESMLRTDKLSLGASQPSLCKRSTVALVALIATMSAASSVRADVLATATRTNLITGGGTQVVALPLTNNDRSTRLVFSTTVAQQKVVITYNAECQVKGGGFVVVTVNVDGTEADPASGTNFALCTSAPGNASQPVGAVRQSVFIVGTPGTHSVEVDAVLSVASGGWQLDDTSLVVEK